MYYNLRQKVVTSCIDRRLLQNAATLVTKCVASIYKMLQPLIQNAQLITKCRNPNYKMRELLQNASLLQNAAEHNLSLIRMSMKFGPTRVRGCVQSCIRLANQLKSV